MLCDKCFLPVMLQYKTESATFYVKGLMDAPNPLSGRVRLEVVLGEMRFRPENPRCKCKVQ